MINRENIIHRVKNKGGPSAGKSLSGSAPKFDWESFKNTPNAEEFVKKAYSAAIIKIIREIEDHKNGSVETDLNSMETIIARSLSFTRAEIKGWIENRDWDQIPDIAKFLPDIKRRLPELASRRNPFSAMVSERLAYKVISAVADVPHDPIADFLNSTLTNPRTDDIQLENF